MNLMQKAKKVNAVYNELQEVYSKVSTELEDVEDGELILQVLSTAVETANLLASRYHEAVKDNI